LIDHMRSFLLIPIAIAIVCGVGCAACAALGWSPHPREMFIAAATCIAAGALAIVPMAIVQTKMTPNVANVSQAALMGTMLHLGTCVVVMGAVLLLKIRLAPAFTYWLMAFYVTSLTALAAGLVTEVRALAARASAAATATPPHEQ
jgi:hypothetical protein